MMPQSLRACVRPSSRQPTQPEVPTVLAKCITGAMHWGAKASKEHRGQAPGDGMREMIGRRGIKEAQVMDHLHQSQIPHLVVVCRPRVHFLLLR